MSPLDFVTDSDTKILKNIPPKASTLIFHMLGQAVSMLTITRSVNEP